MIIPATVIMERSVRSLVSGINHRLLTICCALMIATLVIACGGRGDNGDNDTTVAVTIDPADPVVGPAQLIISLADEAGDPITAANVKVEGTMSHAGMEPVLRDAVESGDGQFIVDDFEFTMSGDWFLIISGIIDNSEFEKRIEIGNVDEPAAGPDETPMNMDMDHATSTSSDG